MLRPATDTVLGSHVSAPLACPTKILCPTAANPEGSVNDIGTVGEEIRRGEDLPCARRDSWQIVRYCRSMEPTSRNRR
jgi:hypothetical protein